MHLLMCSIPTDIPKWEVEEVIKNYETVQHMTWLSSENGRRKKEVNGGFMMVGSINRLYEYEEENMLVVKIKGLENAKSILEDVKTMGLASKSIHQYIIPVIV